MSFARIRLVLLMSAITAITVLVPAAASAKNEKPPPPESHCVVHVVGQAEDGKLTMSDPDCYKTKAEADMAASGGLVARTTGLDSFAMAGSTFTLGRHYDGYNGTGSSITVVGSSCTGGYWNTPSWFDNRITSSYNGCGRLRHYDKPGKSGSSTNTYGAGTTDNLAAWMNNRTESVAYYSS